MDARLDTLIERLSALVPAVSRLSRPELEDLVRAIEALHLVRPNGDQLWPINRVALYLGLDPVLAARLLRAPDAPRPFEGEKSAKAWRASELFDWLDRKGRSHLRVVK